MKLRIALAFLVISAAQILSAATLTNDSIVKMVGAGVDDDTIILSINKGNNSFDTSADALVALKQSGVSSKVINTMINPAPAAAPAAAPSARISTAAKTVTIDLPPTITPTAGGEYYLRYTLRYEKDAYNTTNYARGTAIPINTRVKIVDLDDDTLKFQIVDSGQVIKVKNPEKFSGKDINGMAAVMFSDQPTAIEKFPEEISKSIQAGELRLGMTKQQALLTRGYPPAHKTPSTDNCDTWIYWSGRTAYVTIVFRDGIIVEGRGLR